ncbi:alpha/beta fold hydrolase [Streptosporangium carneum]|uniref:Hydrolase YraK n=1 Tax=Streptosporangium carneum TaxID=47481 RepID=A0A9W6HZJ7_9ACTN|nr:alpha/beta hydrolase [Streptosporangium carneum]GLK09270.1 putative hydrolase YraK [Streptosporangium carneum]
MDTGTLAVPGADLYYEVRGSGPPLLLVNGGDGDAALFGPLAALLAEHHTVVTYDLRGNSRSRLTEPAREQWIGEHADDAHLLLRAIGDEPARVFGTSYGAMIGMDLLARHPAQVRSLVAHEPFLIELLPDAERWHTLFQEVHETYRRDGVGKAIRVLNAEVGVEIPPEPSAALPAPVLEMLARVQANMETCLEYELRSFVRFRPDMDALRAARLAVVAGADSCETLPHRIAAVLAARLDVQLLEFPCDHVGFLRCPAEFAEALGDVFDRLDR